MKSFFIFSACILLTCGFIKSGVTKREAPHTKLSAYGFFRGQLKEHLPAADVIPYQLSSPLFSDYAEKLRFVYIPPGTKADYNDTAVFDFPMGTVLIKTFYYPADFRKPAGNKTLIETRLLIKKDKDWIALPYIWNEEQTDAILDVAGETKKVRFIDSHGKKQQHDYIIPNQNQCKGCHNKSEVMMPIGPTAWQLNFENQFESGSVNQLDYWVSLNKLNNKPLASSVPKAVFWDQPSSGSIEERARIYLDINCGHCHRPGGPAGTSGMYLHLAEKNDLQLGVGKTPVAAGRGSGNLKFSIVPGHPEESILVYRMQSADPGIMMPELGRTIIHREGIELIKQWIRSMKTVTH